MDDWEANWNRDVLERIVALLFALAGLADRAAGASFLRRRRVLRILRHGEAAARAFLMGTACDAAAPIDVADTAGGAVRLAARLRALALLLCAVLAQASLFDLPGETAWRVGREVLAWRVGNSIAPPAADTS